MKIKLLILSFAICGLTNAQNITAYFSWTDACLNGPSCFTDMSTSNNGSIISWAWDFGDSSNSTIQNPCHIYQNPGTYNVCLTVQNTNGNTNMVCHSVNVFPLPFANFSFSISGNVVTFINLSTGASNWLWDFYPGNPVYTDSSIIVTYPPGAYSACLIVETQFGCADTTCHPFIITSINEINVKDIFSIFPNPFSAQTTLQIDKGFKNATLSVYNSFGQQVKKIENISGQTVTLNRDKLTSGVYFFRLLQDDIILRTGKLILTD